MAILGLLLVRTDLSAVLPPVLTLAVLVALSPLIAFLPPGMVFLFLASRLWRRRLSLLMSRDLGAAPAGNGRQERKSPGRTGLLAASAGLSIVLGVATNGVLAFIAYRLLAG